MKRFNRLTALMTVFAMILSIVCFVTAVSAESEAYDVKTEDIELAYKLEKLGVIKNDYDLSEYVTRGEMADIVATYAAIPKSTGEKVFSDVPAEYEHSGAINALYNTGIIAGDGDGNFRPDEYITYDEALVYIINAIGHKPFAVREGGYPTGYYRIAVKRGMLKDLTINKGTDAALLKDIYKMLDRALLAATVETSYYGDGDITYNLSDTETFLAATYKIRRYKGIVTGIESTGLESKNTNVKEDQIEINGKIYNCSGYVNYNFLGYNVNFYVGTEDDEILYLEKIDKMNETIKIDAEDLLKQKTTVSRIYYEDDTDKEYHIDFALGVDVIYNNQSYDDYGVLANILPDYGYIEALDNNGDGTYDVLFVYEYRNIVVGAIDSYYEKVTDKRNGEVVDLSDNNQYAEIYFVGQTNKLTFDSIQLGDLISITESKKAPRVISAYLPRKTISGKIEAYDSENGYFIDGNWYEEAVGYEGEALVIGLEGTFHLDVNDKIGYYDRAKMEKPSVAVMSGLDYEISSLSTKISIRLFTEKGNFLYAELSENIKIDGVRYDLDDESDVGTVLSALATEVSGGAYKINSAYVVGYKLTADGKISSIDKGGIGGPGNLNVHATKCANLVVRSYLVLDYTNDSSVRVKQRYDTSNGITFGAPSDGELDDLDEYSVYNLLQDVQYGSVSGIYADNLDVYSYEKTEYPMADVILFRGIGSAGSTINIDNTLDVITEVTSVVNSEGIETCKLYMGNESCILAPEVRITSGGISRVAEAAELLISRGGQAPELRPGIAIQYAKNADNEIASIRIGAVFDADADTITPLFSDELTYIERSYDSPTDAKNFMVGTVVGYDSESGQMYFTTSEEDTKVYMLYLMDGSITVYRGDKETAIDGMRSDIATGDKFVARTDRFFVPKHMIIFKR